MGEMLGVSSSNSTPALSLESLVWSSRNYLVTLTSGSGSVTRNILGFYNFDTGLWQSVVPYIRESALLPSPGMPLVVSGPLAIRDQDNHEPNANPDARCAYYNNHNTGTTIKMRQGLAARSLQYITYITKVRLDSIGASGAAFVLCPISYGTDPDNAPDGALALAWNLPGDGTVAGYVVYRNAFTSGWLGLPNTGPVITPPMDYRYWALEVDVTGTRVRILRDKLDGTWEEYLTWQVSATTTPAGIESCPSLNGGASTTKGALTTIHANVIVVEKDSPFVLSGAGGDQDILLWKAMTRTPEFDVVGGTWSQNNGCGASPKASTLADVEHRDRIGGNTLIYSTAADDQEFEVVNYGGAVDLQAVAVCLVVYADDISSHRGPDQIIARIGAGSISAYTVYKGLNQSLGLTTLYAFLQTEPGGAAWTLEDFNSLRVGVRNTGIPASERQVYGMVVMALGNGWGRQSKLACPPVPTQHQYAMRVAGRRR